jgi:hypothetical protein
MVADFFSEGTRMLAHDIEFFRTGLRSQDALEWRSG